MTGFTTYTDAVLAQAAERADAEAFAFWADAGADQAPARLSYDALDERAKGIAAWLQERGLTGRQVLLLYPSGLDFVAAFLGCLYAGAVAVPAPLPSEQGRHFSRVARIAEDAGAAAVLTVAAQAPDVRRWLAGERPRTPCLSTDTAEVGDAAHWRRPGLGPDDLAFLQYTSGSTSDPKGVMVSQGNLLANMAAMRRSLSAGPDSVLGSWLPLYHDMGLIGHVLLPLWLGARAALMSPFAFLRSPVSWLRLIGDHGVTIGGGPDFAYEMCVRRVKEADLAALDLSSWQQACNGAEPVRAETIRTFTERFAPAGFRPEAFFPCYGMAETTLLISGTPLGRAPVLRTVDSADLERGRLNDAPAGNATRTLVSSGVVRAEDFEVRIVDPGTRRALDEGGVGEIWVRGPSVARGYWGRSGPDDAAFRAVIAGAEDDGAWLRTGDLGSLHEGELFVTGRLKEMMLINGRNLYPHDIESAARAVDPVLGTAAAFAVAGPDEGRERLVLVQECRRPADPGALIRRLQSAVAAEFSVPVGNVLLVRPGTVRRTTSGKIQRTLMRTLFLQGRCAPVQAVVEPSVEGMITPLSGPQ